MGRAIIKLNDGKRDWYLEWSSVCDAPYTGGMSLQELFEHIADAEGAQGLAELPARLARVEEKGTSSYDSPDVISVIGFNRAGEGETCLTMAQLIEVYCYGKPRMRGHKHKVDKDGCSGPEDCAVYDASPAKGGGK